MCVCVLKGTAASCTRLSDGITYAPHCGRPFKLHIYFEYTPGGTTQLDSAGKGGGGYKYLGIRNGLKTTSGAFLGDYAKLKRHAGISIHLSCMIRFVCYG